MKYLILGTLALLLILSQSTLAQKWEELDPAVVRGSAPPTGRELLDVAIAYVKQKGEFESTKAPFPGDYYDGGSGSDEKTKFARLNTLTLTYYRYNFLLRESLGNATVNATAIVSYNPSNSNFVVTNYSYHINYHGQDNGQSEGNPGYHESLVDARTITGDGDLASDVTECFNYAIADQIEWGKIPEAKYSIQYVYGAYMHQYDGDEAVNQEGEFNEEQIEEEEEEEEKEVEEEADVDVVEREGEGEIVEEENDGVIDDEETESGPDPGYKFYEISLKVKSSEGKYYYMILEVHYAKENGEFVLDKSHTLGDFKPLE